MSKEHSSLINKILLKFSKGDFRLWRNETGVAIRPNGKRLIRYGLPGSSDIIGIGPNGKFIAIEVKTSKDTQKPSQKNFESMITKLGGHYTVARSIEDVDYFIMRINIDKPLVPAHHFD